MHSVVSGREDTTLWPDSMQATAAILPRIPDGKGQLPTLDELETLAIHYGGLAVETQRSYLRYWTIYRDGGFNLTAKSLTRWMQLAHEQNKGKAVIRHMQNAVRVYARGMDREFTGQDIMRIKSVLKRTMRECRNMGTGPAEGASWEVADKAARVAAVEGTEAGLRDCAIILIGSDALLRIGEIARIRCRDISASRNQLYIPHSKTDQTGDGAYCFLRKSTIAAINRYLKVTGRTLESEGRLFLSLRQQSGSGGLSTKSVGTVIRKRLLAVGLKGARGHSLRRGAAASLAEAGADIFEIAEAGRWSDVNVVAGYIRGQRPNAVAKYRRGQI